MNRTNMGQENEEEERASVSTLAYFLNSEDKVDVQTTYKMLAA